MMSRSIFITATDTDAGKTWVSASLLTCLLEQGKNAQAIKPIACGVNKEGVNDDVAILLEKQPDLNENDIQFHTFQSPLAPALASQKEQFPLDIPSLTRWVLKQSEQADITLIEGVGGLMVPLQMMASKNILLSDWMQELPTMDVMLVAPLRLGCMNQVLLSVFALSQANANLKWIVLNDLNDLGTAAETEAMVRPFIQGYFAVMPEFIHLKKNECMPSVL